MVRVGLIGVGRWGPNLLRNLLALDAADVRMVADLDPRRLRELQPHLGPAVPTTDYRRILASSEVDAVVIATPPSTHAPLAREALEARKHVLVEKPLATSVTDAVELIALAKQHGRILMVGHTSLYTPAVRRLKAYLRGGDLGDVRYLYTRRLNLGRVRPDINALWEIGPHEISIVLYLLDELPTEVSAQAFDYVQPGVADVVFMTLVFRGRVAAHLHLSWLDPQKERRVVVVGSRKMAVYDDTAADAKLLIYDRGIEPASSVSHARTSNGELGMPIVRSGGVEAPQLDASEPLRVECAHFIECIQHGRAPLTGGEQALAVIRVLDAAQRSITSGGMTQALDGERPLATGILANLTPRRVHLPP